MRSTELDRQVELLAAKQHGAFSRRQAFDLGATDRFVHRRLAQRHWLRQVAGVYVLPNSAGTWFRQCKVAELYVDSSALAGRAAAALLGIPGFRHGPIELVGPANAHRIHPFAIVHRYAGAKLTVVEGIRTTTYAQTLFDVAPRTNVWGLERGIDDGLISKRVTVGELSERLSFYNSSRREGLAKIRPFIIERLEDDGSHQRASSKRCCTQRSAAYRVALVSSDRPRSRGVRRDLVVWTCCSPTTD